MGWRLDTKVPVWVSEGSIQSYCQMTHGVEMWVRNLMPPATEALCLGTQAWHLVLLRRTCSHRQGWPLWALEAGFRVDEIELGRDDNGRALVAKPGGWLLGQVTLGGLQEMRESSKWAKQS